MRWLLVLLCACGRISFDRVGDAASTESSYCAEAQHVSAGRDHACLVDEAGAVWCWGLNDVGQAVPIDTGERQVLVPTQVTLPAAAVDIDAGRDVTCARLIDQTVWCWGDNTVGQLGAGAIGGAFELRQAMVTGAIELSVGAQTACIRRASDQSIVCWGSGRFDERGAGGASATPEVLAGTAGAKALRFGHRHSCFIDSADQVQCWGRNTDGQLGIAGVDRAMPFLVSAASPASAVGVGGRSTCAVKADGTVACWGQNENGELGDGTHTASVAPVTAQVSNALDVHIATAGTCALRRDGTVVCWGAHNAGEGAFGSDLAPRTSLATGVTELSANFYHTCAIADGRAVCWGPDDTYAHLGRGTRGIAATPQIVALDGLPASSVSISMQSVCASGGDRMLCWGTNHHGQLGDGTRDGRVRPVEVTTGLGTIAGISAGRASSCAWSSTQAKCWGHNFYGEVGSGVLSRDEVTPVPVVNLGSPIRAVVASWTQACALVGSSVSCWGRNMYGEVGDGTTTVRRAPVATGITTAASIAVGRLHACAVLTDNTLQCWGRNANAELGDGTAVNRPSPVAIAVDGGLPIARVALGDGYSCAVTTAGALYCWGANDVGQLGTGDTAIYLRPTLVIASGVETVSLGWTTTCARLTDGRTLCWGEGGNGQLANGTTTSLLSPTHVPALDGVDELVMGSDGGCARRGTAVECWGARRLLADGDVSFATPQPPHMPCP